MMSNLLFYRFIILNILALAIVAALGWLVALGLLGTVIGFSMALAGIDQGAVATANGAQSAVTALMQGMRVALNTTLVGAALALWHEVNIRMLKTALTIYWADRVAVWQAAPSLPIGYPVATKVQHRPNGGVPPSASVVERKQSVTVRTVAELERIDR